jgi:hypothetical protein
MKKIFLGMVVGVLLGLSITVFAATYTAKIATFGIFVNGERFENAEAVVINSRTYLPVRALSEALGIPINWNEELRRVEIGTVNETKEIVENTVKRFKNGTYLVNEDIESGLYKVILTDTFMKMGYVARHNNLSMEFDSIIANNTFNGNGYVEIDKSDLAVKVQGVEIYKINYNELKVNIKNEVGDGIYLVGKDLLPGRYKVKVTDDIMGMGYVERSKSVSMSFDNIIANEVFSGDGYVDIKESDFAIKVQGATLTKM